MTDITLEKVDQPLFELSSLQEDLRARHTELLERIDYLQRERAMVNSNIKEARVEVTKIERVLKAVEGRKPRAKK